MSEDRAAADTDVVTKLSSHSVAGTVAKLTGMISAKGMRLFAVIDQAAGARQAGLTLRETTLVIFGSPEAGTPVMAASPLAALDLPQRPHRCASGFLAPDSRHRESPGLSADARSSRQGERR
jgi:uncharacterized protein (DUF302 family)